ncbi:MAG: hypothetical protein H6735_11750 [Alphaproteobacteria bacterium]|nr:hypothetical protein [Alphaproteobacteria bacterium]
MLAAAGCKKDEITWVPFNLEDQTLVVDVLPEGSAVGDPVSLELLSNLGRTVVGQATIDPGSGPVGTEHVIMVDVLDDFEAIVGRVTVGVNPEATKDLDGDGEIESRGSDEYELQQDSADPGAWQVTVMSLGSSDEQREDVFTINLWQPDELLPETTTQ